VNAGAYNFNITGNSVTDFNYFNICATDPLFASGLYLTGDSAMTNGSSNSWGGGGNSGGAPNHASWGVYFGVNNYGSLAQEQDLKTNTSLYGYSPGASDIGADQVAGQVLEDGTFSVTSTVPGGAAFRAFSKGSPNFATLEPEAHPNQLTFGYWLGSSWGMVQNPGAHMAMAFAAGGGAPTISGTCPIAAQTSGNTSGTFKASAACQAGTIVLAFATKMNGWSCQASDWTHPANLVSQTNSSATTATLTGTLAKDDTVSFICVGH
jgi:hypothetical protein